MHVLRNILWFLFYRPTPDESLIIRLAMAFFAVACTAASVVAMAQLHWAFFVLLGFAALLWGALFYMWRMLRDARVIRLTPAARAFLDQMPLNDTQRVRLLVTRGPGGEKGSAIALVDDFDREMDRELRPHGIPFVIDRREVPQLEETLIDYVHREQDEGFVVHSPKV